MSVHEMFHGDFTFKSNDSLDTQITASIDRGDFHLAVLSLLSLVVWSIYMLFYNSRLVGLIVSIALRRFLKQGYIRFGSISFSILSGKVMIRDFAFMTNDYTVRCCYAIFVFNYWTNFVLDHKSSSERRCLYVYLYGFEAHIYNRTSMYDRLRDLFQIKDRATDSPQLCTLQFGPKKNAGRTVPQLGASHKHHALVEDDDESVTGENSSGFLDSFWTHARRLISCIKFKLELVKLCAGNHLLPRALVFTCSRSAGTYTLLDAPCREDKYQHNIAAEFANISCSFSVVSKYDGQHAIEEPPKSWDNAFLLFHFGRGRVTYAQDEAGLHSSDSDQMSMDDTNLLRTWPSWGLKVQVTKDCRINYGPWADRQRNLLWSFFFPPSYQDAQPSDPPIVGRRRMPQKFDFELTTKTDITMDIYFSTSSSIECFRLLGLAESSIKLHIPWIIGVDGITTPLHVSLMGGRLEAHHLWSDVLRTSELKLDLRMHFPLQWNAPQTWDLELDALNANLVVLFDYKRFFKGLVEDWTRGTHPDLLTFVPCTYKFRIIARNLNFILLANEYNWVSANGENAHISFWGKRFLLSFDLPFIDFLPMTVPIVYQVEAFCVELRLSLPEASTMLYVIRELHSRLKLVDRSGRLQSSVPFHIHTENVSDGKNGQSFQRHWIDCAWAPRVTLRIGYIYHPSPWTSEYWRFLPPKMRPSMPIVKISNRSVIPAVRSGRQHRRWGRRHGNKLPVVTPLLKPQSDSSSQSEIEEVALRGLRPEGNQTQGPTEDHLLKSGFDASHFPPDTVDVHLHIAHAQLCFYGTLLRHFVHVKENYFGCYQRPVDFAGPPMSPEDYQRTLDEYSLVPSVGASNDTVKRSKTKRIVDPRECRPILVRLSLEFHNIQAHLPTHSCCSIAPCPTAFLDCIGFEMDKRWHETKIQLLLSPILLCAYDRCQDSRPKASSNLARGRLQLMGLCLRGQGCFSHYGLPLAAETVEYAWLLELTVGRFGGQLTVPQLAGIVRTLNSFIFTATDSENQLVCSRDFELCQHARPQVLCSSSTALSTDVLCPGETCLKYRLIRFNLDGLDLALVETGTCLSLQLDYIRLTNCNMHGLEQCNGLFAVLPQVRIVQLIRPIAGDSQDVKTKLTEVPSLSTNPMFHSRWIEAGSLSFGPVHVNISGTADQSVQPFCRLAFLRRHDARTKRLWFLWSDIGYSSPHSKGRQSSSIESTFLSKCGCYGHCSFFGQNEGGRALLQELSSCTFKPRTIFPPRCVYRPDLYANEKTTATDMGIGWDSLRRVTITSQDNLPEASLNASRFGESLLVPHRLLHELHNPAHCVERKNGLLLLRDEVITAAKLAEFSTTGCTCCEDGEFSDEASISVSSVTHSYPTSLSAVSTDTISRLDDVGTLSFAYKRTKMEIQRSDGGDKIKSSGPSSMSELLVPPESGDEDPLDSEPLVVPSNAELKEGKHTRRQTSRLPSNLSLNSLIGPLTPASSISSMNANDVRDSRSPLTTGEHQMPPTPPPRRFVNMNFQNGYPSNEPISHQDSTRSALRTDVQTDVFDKYVDLRNQLHRPITESGLLRSAYSRHLSVYECVSGWAERVILDKRWHLCKHIYSGVGLPAGTEYPTKNSSLPRLGAAVAPQFKLIQTGFSPRLITLRPEAQGQSTKESNQYERHSDPKFHGRSTPGSKIIVRFCGPLEILLSPLFTEAIERFLSTLTPVLGNTPASTVVDNMHSTCIKLCTNQFLETKKSTSLYGFSSKGGSKMHKGVAGSSNSSQLRPINNLSRPYSPSSSSTSKILLVKKSPIPVPLPSGDSKRENISNNLTGEVVNGRRISTDQSSSLARQLKCIKPDNMDMKTQQQYSKNRTLNKLSCSTVSIGKLAAFSIERIDICFIQLYAIEDMVHLDSLRSGLQDLTCASALAFCVDSVSFELLSYRPCRLIQHPMLRHDSMLGGSMDGKSPLYSVRNQESPLHKCSSLYDPHTSFKSDFVEEEQSKLLPRLSNHPSLPGPEAVSKNFELSDDCPLRHSRQPSAPPVLTKTWNMPNEYLSAEPEQKANVVSGNGTEPQSISVLQYPGLCNSQLVCELGVRRIHVQLRRLTRCSQFNADILLTAIPFESSRTFFTFESDRHATGCTSSVRPNLWDDQSAGWIMFECGVERLSLSCNRRCGLDEFSVDVDGVQNDDFVSLGNLGDTNSRHRNPNSVENFADSEPLSKLRIGEADGTTGSPDGTAAQYSEEPHKPTDQKNGFLTRLFVDRVWFNFATPKRLPNKRRIELVRSDWNLLSTLAPSIKAWMDPSYRLMVGCRDLYKCLERRFLAVTACLMMEAANPQSSVYGDNERITIFHTIGDKNLGCYAQRRTAVAQSLRFDPSCQLLLLLRQYLLTLSNKFGHNEADRILGEWLQSSQIPPTEILQCGILSLTREWRFLVEMLALSANDLQCTIDTQLSIPHPFSSKVELKTRRRNSEAAKGTKPLVDTFNLKSIKQHRSLSKISQTLNTPLIQPPSIAGNIKFISDPNSGLTSKLLRMATGAISPGVHHSAYEAHRSSQAQEFSEMGGDTSAFTKSNMGNQPVMESDPYEPQGDLKWDVCEPAHGDNYNDTDANLQNVILRRFLSDAKVPLAKAVYRDIPESEGNTFGNEAIAQMHVKESSRPPLDRSAKGEEPFPTVIVSDTSEENNRNGTYNITMGTFPDQRHHNGANEEHVTVTTADIEQAAHLSAQFQHVAYIQRFFSPLLESVGLSPKGIRRTTLMNKFGGYFSVDGLLKTFQIEIVSSTRNPLANHDQNPPATTEPTLCHKRHGNVTSVGRKSAFLCRNFGSRLTVRDVVEHTNAKDILPNTASANRFDLISTTTKVHVMLNVEFLSQHVNLPLLRLVHQFVTMFYCARDTRKILRPLDLSTLNRSDVRIGAHAKLDSKDSSDHTDGTVRSRSSGFVRFGDSSSGSGDPSDDAPCPSHVNSVDIPEVPISTVSRDRISGYIFPDAYLDRSPHAINTQSGVDPHPSGPRLMNRLNQYNVDHSHSPSTPSCWQRLFNYVELYTTVPKTRMIIRKPISSGGNSGMPTITEEDRSYFHVSESGTSEPLKIKVPAESQYFDCKSSPSTMNIKPTTASIARRLLPTVGYQPLGKDQDLEANEIAPTLVSNLHLPFVSDAANQNTRVSPSVFSQDMCDGVSSSAGLRKHSEMRVSASAFEQFTYPWICSERLPLSVLLTAKVHHMAVTAVLSELNLSASLRNVHCSVVHSTQIRGRGSFAERYSSQSFSLHCKEGQVQLTEHLPPLVQQVVYMRCGPSHAFLSCGRSRTGERNTCLVSVGKVSVTLPHHPVRLHGVMQRQAKRISSTMMELLRSSPAMRNPPYSMNPTETCRLATTPTNCSTTTTTTSDTTGQFGRTRSLYQFVPQPSIPPARVSTAPPAPPLVFSIFAVAQGLTINVALHATLTAIYHMNPLYVVGQLGPRGHVDINLTEHSLSLQSLRPPVSFPQSIRLDLPRVSATVVRRVSAGGRYARGATKELMITEGLTAEEGLYLDIQVTVGTLEQTLTTDMLNYIMVVIKLFMNEINEVIQKMAGEEQSTKGAARYRSFHASQFYAQNDSQKPTGSLLSRASGSKPKFTIRIRMTEIQLMATTVNGALKLEARKIDVELTNRVSQTAINTNLFSVTKTSLPDREEPRGPRRPSNLNLRSKMEPGLHTSETKPGSPSLSGSGDSLLIYVSVGHLCGELGYLEQDVFFKERTPEFKTVALFKASIALRSLLANEMFTSSNDIAQVADRCTSCERDAFLISLSRPTLWIKPFTFDRGILMWMVYKQELAKWNEHMQYLVSMTPASAELETLSRQSSKRKYSPVNFSDRHTLFGPVISTPSVHTTASPTANIPPEMSSTTTTHRDTASHTETHVEGPITSTLFLQLNVEELGVCFPINAFPHTVQSETDSCTALVLTLDHSRISACYRESLVSQSEFTDFCLRFDDEFNAGSDDWGPDRKRATVDVKGTPHLVILNACVVPSGTFNVCWRDLDNRAQWHLVIRWEMRGLDFHFDDNIGRRIKSLVGILTRITGYKDAAPLLPSSVEVDEQLPDLSTHRTEIETHLDEQINHLSNNIPVGSKSAQGPSHPLVSCAPSDRHSDSSSLNHERIFQEDILPKLAQVRSMELHKHKRELLEAKYCQAFKRQKWNTLRKRGQVMSRSPLLQSRLVGSRSVQRMEPESSVGDSSEKVVTTQTRGRTHTHSYRSSTLESGDGDSDSAIPSSNIPNVGRRSSLLSYGDSIYFDVDSLGRDAPPMNDQVLDLSSSYESFNGEQTLKTGCKPSPTKERHDSLDDDCGPLNADIWTTSVENRFTSDCFLTDSSESDNPNQLVSTVLKSSVVAKDSGMVEVGNLGDISNDPPPPPPRRTAFLEPVRGSACPVAYGEDTERASKVQLKVEVQIHVDSGCCVLHPRLLVAGLNNDLENGDQTVSSFRTWGNERPSVFASLDASRATLPPLPRMNIQSAFPSRSQLDGGLRSTCESLSLYHERYKQYLLQDPQFLTTNLSVFYLPAVDIGLHYNSMTEMDLKSTAVDCSGPYSQGSKLLSNVSSMPETTVATESFTRSDSGRVRYQPSFIDGDSKSPKQNAAASSLNATLPSGLKKTAELYISCFLQKLPHELVIHPALLDFLEQALENIPVFNETEVDGNDDRTSGQKESNGSGPGPAFNDLLSESFPVHTVVHLHVRPSTVRLLCLPTSRMQCLLMLPFLDLIFSTKHDPMELPEAHDSTITSRNEKENADLCSSSINVTTVSNGGSIVRLKTHDGDVISQGGMSVTAILKEFRISVFYPFGDVKANRLDVNSTPTFSSDSLTLSVRDVQFNLSRVVQLILNQNAKSTSCVGIDPIVNGRSLANGIYQVVTSSTTPLNAAGDTWMLHRTVRFSGIFDIGTAIFTCDTRRTLEVLDIPKAWYRSSLARRLFLGDEDVIDQFDASDVKRTVLASDACFSQSLDDRMDASRSYPVADDSLRMDTVTSSDIDALQPESVIRDHSATIPPTLDNLVSQSTTLAAERASGLNASPNGSLKVASWDALPIFCVHLKRFDLNLYMGSVMGLTRLTIDNLFCKGRTSVHSGGRKNTVVCAGLQTCQFASDGGCVGGEFCLLDSDALMRLDDDPLHDPEHNLDCRIRGVQLRIEYMSTNILLLRLNTVNLLLQDEWRLRDFARKHLSNRLMGKVNDVSPSLINSGGATKSSEATDADIGIPPIFFRVMGEFNWDQAQFAIVRTTTPDLMHAVMKVREYFEEQVRKGRISLGDRVVPFSLFSTAEQKVTHNQSQYASGVGSYVDDSQDLTEHLTEAEKQLVDKLLQRHWQNLYQSIKTYAADQLGLSFGTAENVTISKGENYPVLGGSFQLSGRSLGIACFAGSFRSAPDWAVFNIQYPTACFETEAQHEPPSYSTSAAVKSDEVDGWMNVRQVLSFDLGAHPHFQPQMAYVLRVRRGRQPNTRSPPTLSIAEWFEFSFLGADNTVSNFVRTHDATHLPFVVQLSHFPISFPRGIPTMGSNPFMDFPSGPVRTQNKDQASDSESSTLIPLVPTTQNDESVTPLSWKHRLPNISLRKSGNFNPSTTVSSCSSAPTDTPDVPPLTAGTSNLPDTTPVMLRTSALNVETTPVRSPSVRSNPLKPPADAEILFVLPSISLRITSDQRQTIAQPSFSMLPFIEPHVGTVVSGTKDSKNLEPNDSIIPANTVSVSKPATSVDHDDSGAHPVKEELGSINPPVASASTSSALFAPVVKISFQTDFHGFVQLGLIDVPWLPTLINSYLNERLQEYELNALDSQPSMERCAMFGTGASSFDTLTKRLRKFAATSSPLVLDARKYEIVHWSLSPECRWLLATSIGVPAFDRLLESVGFRKARTTIPKWLQRGVMDHLDNITSTLLKGILRLITDANTTKMVVTKTVDSGTLNTTKHDIVDDNSARYTCPSSRRKRSARKPHFTLSLEKD